MYRSTDRLIIFDADGTLIDASSAIGITFAHHGMDIGDLERFQKRRELFKYISGIKELPRNLAKHMGKHVRKELLDTLTEVYREEALLYPGRVELILRFDRFAWYPGRYPWTVVPVEAHNAYMAALEDASVRQDIGPFTDFLARLVEAGLKGEAAPSVPDVA